MKTRPVSHTAHPRTPTTRTAQDTHLNDIGARELLVADAVQHAVELPRRAQPRVLDAQPQPRTGVGCG